MKEYVNAREHQLIEQSRLDETKKALAIELTGDGIKVSDVMKGLIEDVKLEPGMSTGTKDVKAFFQTYKGRPQVCFKYGGQFYSFNITPSTLEEKEYAVKNNYK